MIKPLADKVVIMPIEGADTTPGGILIPEAAKEKPMRGTVLAKGPGRFTESGNQVPVTVGVGDKVLYQRHSGIEIKVNDVKCLILKEADILAVEEAAE